MRNGETRKGTVVATPTGEDVRGADGVKDDVEPSAIPSTATDEPIASEIPAGDGLENSPGSDNGCRVTSGW
ncbi:hypothetical protein [Natrialba sp. PRR66]|uniref:hypothetical protein n=1 Tax=Natrialba sp. PRR66 TaxID=3098146 RepID=UPI002B1DA09F|nr:hypothetical protein [Natrialba sp. PRR66]